MVRGGTMSTRTDGGVAAEVRASTGDDEGVAVDGVAGRFVHIPPALSFAPAFALLRLELVSVFMSSAPPGRSCCAEQLLIRSCGEYVLEVIEDAPIFQETDWRYAIVRKTVELLACCTAPLVITPRLQKKLQIWKVEDSGVTL